MKLKVCGMRSHENILALSDLKPDYMGFIFWKPSKRFVSTTTPTLPSNIKKTGVFVDETFDEIKSLIETHQLQAIQLHGNENPIFCDRLKDLNVEIIKVFSIKKDFDFSTLAPYENVCDYFLFDTKGELPGGNGYAFDWKMLKSYPSSKPFFLSGGIGMDQLADLEDIFKLNLPLYAIDVNSKFESEAGMKKIELLKDFKIALFK
jgi:phosphoribosylanthranilate isomerase